MSNAATATAPAPAAPADTTAKPVKAASKMRLRTRILLIVLSLLLMAVMRTGFIFVLVAMMPSIVTYYIDRSPHQFTFKTIFALNLSGTLPYVAKLLHYGPGGIMLQETMQAPGTWIIIYGAAFVGYLLTAVAPVFAYFMISNFHATQVTRLERSLKKIEGEWGEEVARLSRLTDDKH